MLFIFLRIYIYTRLFVVNKLYKHVYETIKLKNIKVIEKGHNEKVE